jgi:transcriptional regulator with XRE-family HTH domain
LCHHKRSAIFDPVAKPEWPARLTAGVADEIRRHRKARGLSVRQLSEVAESVGMPIQPPVLSNLELHRRETISAAELLALGAALSVPPLLLLFPIGRVDRMEPLPGVEVSPLHALHWAETGVLTEARQRGIEPASEQESRLIERYRRHEQLVSQWGLASGRAAFVREHLDRDGAEQELRALEREQQVALEALRDLREMLRWSGLTPPELPGPLRYLDEEAS